MFDNTLELLVLAGRPLAHAMMMMIPEPWSNHETMDADRRAFYQYPLLPDGAVGRPGVDRVSPTASRSAPSSIATACAPRATTSPGTGSSSWRPETGVLDIPAERDRREGPAAARASVPRRYRAGTDHRGRGDQAAARRRASLRASGSTSTWFISSDLPAAPEVPHAGSRHAAAAPDRVRLHVRG